MPSKPYGAAMAVAALITIAQQQHDAQPPVEEAPPRTGEGALGETDR